MIFFVGTQTRIGGPGIAICSLESNQLELLSAVMLPNPNYIILSSDKKCLYAGSSDSADGSEGGSAASYRVDGNQLSLISRSNNGASGPCFLCLSPDERFLYTANYQSGSLSVFPQTECRLGETIQLVQHEGSGLHPTRQLGAHVHQVSFIPGTNKLCVVDLGIDAVFIYSQDPTTGLLTFASRLNCQPGSGPRHVAYGKNGLIYLANELDSTVSVLKREGDTLTCLQTLSTLPAGWHGENTCAAIRSDDQHIYVSNRGHNSLSIFKQKGDGLLEIIETCKTGSSIPRDFIKLDAKHFLVAHQAGDVSLLAWVPGQGMIKATNPLPINGAVCVCPLCDTRF